ncbi:MAG TPA: serine/threonine-protein kinase [Ktedonobacterales bacterium]|jgi:serine/threonine protein kinase
MEWDHLVGQQLGQYELLTELGKGTYASTYQAFQPRLRRHVAIKALRGAEEDQRSFLQQFEQIAQAIAQLNHPNIVAIYDFGEEQGLAYIVMQTVTGGSVKKRLGQPMAVGEAVTPIIQLARALHHAHQRGVLHLDIRPENILVDQENASHLLLTDFSISQLFQAEYQARTGVPIGAPSYLAPEQIEGRQPTTRTDIYALGALLFEMLAGRPAFSGPSAATIFNKQLHEPPPYIRGFNPAIPRELAHVVSRAMAKQPGERYESAEALARALEPYRDTREREHRLHLTLDDLNIVDDDEPEEAAPPPRAAPSGQPGRGNRPQGSEQSHRMTISFLEPEAGVGPHLKARAAGYPGFLNKKRALTEPPALPEKGLAIAERASLVNMIGARVFRLARRVAGKTALGQWIEHISRDTGAQGVAGISAICLALLLSLSITLLAVSTPVQMGAQNANFIGGASQTTPTSASTPTPSPTTAPSPAPTPRGPVIDRQAAAALANISAALNTDNRCQINPNGATLPTGQAFYVTVCFNKQVIASGGTAKVTLLPSGSRSASASKSAEVSGGASYFWFQFSSLARGKYTIEVFWNGRLGKVYLLTIN